VTGTRVASFGVHAHWWVRPGFRGTLETWQYVWTKRTVPGFESAKDFWDSQLGRALRYPRVPIMIDIFLHDPLPAENGKPEDPSHAVIGGIPIEKTPEAELVQDLFVDCILNQFDVTPD
jgi:hypothetical protein